jgi:integrase
MKTIESLPSPTEADREYYYDAKQQGLILMVTRTGAKSFQIRKRFNGNPVRLTIGKFPQMSIEQARKQAIESYAKFSIGENPNEEKDAIRREETFGGFFNQYMENYSKKKKRSWKYDEREVNKFLGEWFNRKLSSIAKHEVLAKHLNVTDNHGDYAANRLLERIRAIFNKAIEWGWQGENPARGIKKNREKSRDRFLQPNELPKFLKALKSEKNKIVADYIRVSLQTGARKTNVLSMRWEEINFASKTWRIPETKNGDPLTIALTDSVIKVLEGRKRKNKKKLKVDSPWVFPGVDANSHIKDPKKAWKRILTAAKIKDLRIHDLRRTFGSYLAAAGATTTIIGKSLGHKSPLSTRVYERLNLDPVRTFVTKTEDIFNPKKKKSDNA